MFLVRIGSVLIITLRVRQAGNIMVKALVSRLVIVIVCTIFQKIMVFVQKDIGIVVTHIIRRKMMKVSVVKFRWLGHMSKLQKGMQFRAKQDIIVHRV